MNLLAAIEKDLTDTQLTYYSTMAQVLAVFWAVYAFQSGTFRPGRMRTHWQAAVAIAGSCAFLFSEFVLLNALFKNAPLPEWCGWVVMWTFAFFLASAAAYPIGMTVVARLTERDEERARSSTKADPVKEKSDDDQGEEAPEEIHH